MNAIKNPFFYFILSWILLSSCGGTKQIKISGSSTLWPAVTLAAQAYNHQRGEQIVSVAQGGSGKGIDQVGKGEVEIAMASRPYTDEELKNFPDLKMYSVAVDAVIPVVSAEIYDSGIQLLTLSQLGAIYRGEIKNWAELGGPNLEIYCVDKESSRGSRYVFMKVITGDPHTLAAGADVVVGPNDEEQKVIQESNAAIGMLSHAWMNKHVRGLSIKLSDGRIIEPTYGNFISGVHPMLRKLYLITNGEATGGVKEFIEFVLSDPGQLCMQNSGYVPVKKPAGAASN